MIPKIYDDPLSLIHTLVGGLAGYSIKYNPIVSIGLSLIFTAYQLREKEKIASKIGDFIEFIIGFGIGIII